MSASSRMKFIHSYGFGHVAALSLSAQAQIPPAAESAMGKPPAPAALRRKNAAPPRRGPPPQQAARPAPPPGGQPAGQIHREEWSRRPRWPAARPLRWIRTVAPLGRTRLSRQPGLEEGGRWRRETRNGRSGWWWDVGGVWSCIIRSGCQARRPISPGPITTTSPVACAPPAAAMRPLRRRLHRSIPAPVRSVGPSSAACSVT